MTSFCMRTHSVRPPQGFGRQRGAVLYVALIMLVLLALIGIVGMQVAGMQERMAANYRAVNMAFQNTEGNLRSTECTIQDIEDGTTTTGCDVISEAAINRRCDDGFDVGHWLDGQTLASAPARSVRQIDKCIVGESSIAMGIGPDGSVAPTKIYQITTYDADSTTNPSSSAAIDAVYKL
ncbi:pilus assembly PilX family protein [Luteimonas sp. A501]